MFRTYRHRPPANVIGSRIRRHRRILELEGLEERVVLSPTIYTVDATTDNGPTSAGSGSGPTGDLRYVIGQANANSNPDGSIIQFDPTVFATPQTITLSSSLGTLNLTETDGPEEIGGPTAGVSVAGGGAVAVFQVSKDVTATLSGVTITGGWTSSSGGGGLDDEAGTVTLTNCTISGNTALLDSGGGLYNHYGIMSLTDCTIARNSANKQGWWRAIQPRYGHTHRLHAYGEYSGRWRRSLQLRHDDTR